MQFKFLQDVVILGMTINGDKMDVNGRFIAHKEFGPKAGQSEVEINTIRLHVDPSRIVDAQEYWNKKRENV